MDRLHAEFQRDGDSWLSASGIVPAKAGTQTAPPCVPWALSGGAAGKADTGCMLWMLLDSRLRENDAAGRDSYTLSAWSGVLHFGVEGPGVHAQ